MPHCFPSISQRPEVHPKLITPARVPIVTHSASGHPTSPPISPLPVPPRDPPSRRVHLRDRHGEKINNNIVNADQSPQLVAQDTIVVIEYPVELGCMPHAIGDGTMVGLRNRRYGRTVVGVWVYLPSGQFGDALDSRPQEFVSIKKK